jgi:hypothetical protein
MTITLLPEQEKVLNAALEAGRIGSVQEFIDTAIAHLTLESAAPVPGPAEPKNLFDLFAPIRGLLSDEEIDTLFARNRSPSRPVDLE